MCACSQSNIQLCTCPGKKDIKVGQVWTTTTKYKVRIIAVDRRDSLPIVGLYSTSSNFDGIGCASPNGSSSVWGDLVSEYKESKKYTFDVVVFDYGSSSALCSWNQTYVGSKFISARKTIIITEGEGL